MPKQHTSRRVKTPTPDTLANAALFYLSRYAASEHSLRQVLKNRLRRASMTDPTFAADHERHALLQKAIEAIIERHKKSGTLNDAAFAETKINALRRAGRSRRVIQQRLNHKGVAATVVNDMLHQSDDGEDPREADLKAAQHLARKRKLGAFRSGDISPDRMRKDLSAMARAGFSFDVAREALGGEQLDKRQNEDDFS